MLGDGCSMICWSVQEHTETPIRTTQPQKEEFKKIADNKPGFITRNVVRLPGVRGCDQGRVWRDLPLYAVQAGEACPIHAYAAASRQQRWYTGAKRINSESSCRCKLLAKPDYGYPFLDLQAGRVKSLIQSAAGSDRQLQWKDQRHDGAFFAAD